MSDTMKPQPAATGDEGVTPVCFWDANDREAGHASPEEILDQLDPGEIVEIEHVGIVHRTFEGRLPASDEFGAAAEFKVCELHAGIAEAKMKAEIDRRARLATKSARGRIGGAK